MPTQFTQLNVGWDADPNAPEPEIRVEGSRLALIFFLKHGSGADFREYDRGELTFAECWRFRLGPPMMRVGTGVCADLAGSLRNGAYSMKLLGIFAWNVWRWIGRSLTSSTQRGVAIICFIFGTRRLNVTRAAGLSVCSEPPRRMWSEFVTPVGRSQLQKAPCSR